MSEDHNKKDSYDELTRLPDMFEFQKKAAVVCSEWNTPHNVVIFYNIENFKLFNSSYSRSEGDALLCFVADTLKRIYSGSLIARFSDDHFVVLTPEKDARLKISAVHQAVKEYPTSMGLEIKAGVDYLDQNEDIMQACDNAKIAADSIKGRADLYYKVYEDSQAQALIRRKKITDHFEDALNQEHIKVYYQPIIRTLSGQLCGLEALARWEDPNHLILQPGTFISALENSRLIYKLDLYMCEHICMDLRHLLDEQKAVVPVSLNLSRLDFELIDVFETIDEIVKRYNLPPNLLDIEITEQALIENNSYLNEALADFRRAGYHIWMDDFGSGYSSLNTLKDYDFDVLKIDMQFLRDFKDKHSGHKSRIIVSSIVSMAKQLGIQTICEGVETEDQLQFLKSAGCEKVQGYYFSRPLPLGEVLKLKFKPETIDDIRYSDAAGRVNLLSENPVHEHEDDLSGSKPMAIVEYKNGYFKFMIMNQAYRNFYQTCNIYTDQEMEDLLNANEANLFERFARALEKSRKEHSEETIDMVINGNYCNIAFRCIAHNEATGASMALITAFSQSGAERLTHNELKEQALRTLYQIYERIDLFDYENDRVITLHQNTERYVGIIDGETIKDAVKAFCELNIYDEDRQRFLNFYDGDLVAKVRSGNMMFRSDLFRVKDRTGSYNWQLFIHIPARLNGSQYLLSCVSDSNLSLNDYLTGRDTENSEEFNNRILSDPTVIKNVLERQDETAFSDSDLLKNLLDLMPYGVFWKDSNRRFLGANRYFMEYYGFDSISDFKGKTDEDVGWHVDPDPFRNDELRVINNGEIIRGAAGTCISHGEVRNITAYKAPVIKNGKINGLVGFFIDHDESELEREEKTDELTRMLNASGAVQAFDEYKKSYRAYGIDFMITSVDIVSFGTFNDRYGRYIGDKMLRKVGQTIISAIGVNSVVARIGGDEFVILNQIESKEKAKLIDQQIASAISQIHEIEGVPCSVSASIETAFYSELSSNAKKNLMTELATHHNL